MRTSPFFSATSRFLHPGLCVALLFGQGCANSGDGEQDSETGARQDTDKDGDGDDSSKDSQGSGSGNNDSDSDGQDTDQDQDTDKPEQAKLFEYKAGDRLTPYFLEAADGASQFYGWYDEKLKSPCSFQMLSSYTLPAAEGAKMRCMPPMVRKELGNYYSDEECKNSIDVAIIDKCADPASIKFAQIDSLSCGEGQLEVREVTQIKAVTSEDKLWYRPNIFTPCSERSTKTIKYAVMMLGETVELDSFVSAETSKK